ncbi:hypothetical protein ACFOZY_00725 [Chungangia koreensis]|uniref:Uncharacterized protein n=1 Tax=Chungangia koreensis TaxID=752657 RepID=A0ABV8X1G3_9LACT
MLGGLMSFVTLKLVDQKMKENGSKGILHTKTNAQDLNLSNEINESDSILTKNSYNQDIGNDYDYNDDFDYDISMEEALERDLRAIDHEAKWLSEESETIFDRSPYDYEDY